MRNKALKSAKWVISALLVIILLLALNGAAVGASGQDIFEYNASSAEGPLFVPGEILVKFQHGVPEEVIERINNKHGASILEVSPWGFMRIGIPKSKSVTEMVEVYSRNQNVEHAGPNSICRLVMTPNDFYYYLQWHLDNAEYGGINMEKAWDISTGEGVVVAVLDTGVAYEDYGVYLQAPDLANTTFVAPADFINDDLHANDDNSHGTHVAGTIAQSTNNDLGVAGVAFNASIMPVKVLDSNGSGTAFSVAGGIYWAVLYEADVISMSLAWPWWLGRMYDPGWPVDEAVREAYDAGITIVAAAGNDRKNKVAYPAAYEQCIAVGATQYNESLAPYTNKGLALELTAPGGNLNLDLNGDGYGDGVLQQTFDPGTKNPTDFSYWFFHGTSMATPHVAGVVALILAEDPSLTPTEVRDILHSTAEDHGDPGWDTEYGWGIVDAYAALASIGPPNNPPEADANGPYSGTEDSAITFDGSGSYDPDGDPLTYTWDFGDGNTGTGATPSHTYLWGGTFTVTLTVSDGKGGTDTTTSRVEVDEVNDPPAADANGPYTGIVNQPISFEGSGSYDPDNQDGTSDNDQTLTYSWDFGDGSDGIGINPSHAYAATGTYTVSLVVSDGIIESDASTAEVIVSAEVAETLQITKALFNSRKAELKIEATSSLGGPPNTTLQATFFVEGAWFGLKDMEYNAKKDKWSVTFTSADGLTVMKPQKVKVISPNTLVETTEIDGK